MNGFRFPLQKALEWRRTQLEMAEAAFRQQLGAVAELDRKREEWEAAGIRAEVEVRGYALMESVDLQALGQFRERVRARQREIAVLRAAAQKDADARQVTLMEARRRCRLLERLRERRLAEWESARDKELEEVAAESFLAQWNRRAG